MLHVNAHRRVTSVEEDFNNQVDRVIHSVVPSYALFPAILSLHNGLMNKMAIVTWMDVIHEHSNVSVHSPGLIWLQLLSAQYATNREH